MRRRDFLGITSGAVLALPLATRAQKLLIPVIGYLSPGSDAASAHITSAFRRGLAETGYVEGRDFKIEFRWAENINARLPELAADLVRVKTAVIVTPASTTA